MKKNILLITLILAAFSSCKKSNNNALDADPSQTILPQIKIINNIQAPMVVTINNEADTLAYKQELIFKGKTGELLTATAKSIPYMLYSADISARFPSATISNYIQPVGDMISIDLTTTYPTSGTYTKAIEIPSSKYLMLIKNNTSDSFIDYLTINYGLATTKTYFFARLNPIVSAGNIRIDANFVANNGILTPIGFFNVVSPTATYFHATNNQFWTFQNIGISGGLAYTFALND